MSLFSCRKALFYQPKMQFFILFVIVLFSFVFTERLMVRADENMSKIFNRYQSIILTQKAEFIRKAIKPSCRMMMNPVLDSCMAEFKVMVNFTTTNLYSDDHRDDLREHYERSFCYAACQYNDCVLKSIQRISEYLLDFCTETDVLCSRSILNGMNMHFETRNSSDNIMKWSNHLCSQTECKHFAFNRNFFTLLISSLALITTLLALLISSYFFYISRKRQLKFRFDPRESTTLMSMIN
uniref:Uncharacterized protein LOC113796045 n=2 Tax=Dermatophagoides pteronyssinus TaxID=6956 RepID=A0A6P6Y9W5_DERPT|nr:uncharacterized protein LOC113796045 [Dermatophagoides pteronyssinus]